MTAPPFRWRTGAWSLTGQAVLALSGAARGVFIVRLLDTGSVGTLFLLMSGAGVVATLGQSGFAVSGLRRVTEDDDPAAVSRELRSVLALALWTSAALGAASAFALSRFHLSVFEIAGVTALMLTQLWIGLLSGLVRGLRQIALSVTHEQVVVPVLQVLVLGGFVARGGVPSIAALIASQAACAVPSVVALSGPVLAAAGVAPRVARESQATRLGESAGVALNSLIWRAYSEVPLWVAGLAFGAAGAALYGVASRLATLLQLPSLAVAAVLSPEIAALLSRRQYDLLEPQLRRAAVIAALMSVAGLTIVVFYGTDLLRFVFGAAFAHAAPVAAVLGLGQVINAAAGSGGVTLLLMNEARRLVVISIVSTAVLTAASWPLARAFGLENLAWAWCAAFTLQNILMIVTVWRLTGMRVYVRLRP